MSTEIHEEAEERFQAARTEAEYRAAAQFIEANIVDPAELHWFQARFFSDLDNPFFNLDFAQENFLRATQLGHPHAPWIYAMRLATGWFGRIDALGYYAFAEIAAERGNVGAQAATFRGALLDHMRLSPEARIHDIERKAVIDRAVQDPASLPMMATVAEMYANGTYVLQDANTALGYYRFMAGREVHVPPSMNAALILGYRYFLGLDLDVDFDAALEAIAWLPDYSGEVRSSLRRMTQADTLRYAVTTEREIRADNTPEVADPFFDALRTHIAYLRDHGPEDLGAAHLRDLGLEPGERLLLRYLHYASVLADLEKWRHANVVRKAVGAQQAIHLELTGDELTASTHQKGPVYNAETGSLPIIGRRLSAGARLDPKRGVANRHCPTDGWLRVEGARVDPGGGLRLLATPANEQPPLITEQDIEDALALAFGDPEGPLWPSLSLEPIAKMLPDEIAWVAQRKVFEPPWFGHTAIGQTFYQADWLLDQVEAACGAAEIDSTTPDAEGLSSTVRRLAEDLALLGGVESGDWSRVMLKPAEVKLTWDRPGPFWRRSRARVQLTELTVQIDGSDCRDTSEEVSDRLRHLNDNDFAAGRYANYLTEHFADLKLVLPIYARLEQLYRLIAILNGLRGQGVRLGADVLDRARARRAQLQKQGAIDAKAEYCWPS